MFVPKSLIINWSTSTSRWHLTNVFWARKRLLASSCPPVCPHWTTWLPLGGFCITFDSLAFFWKSCLENLSFIKIRHEKKTVLYMKTNIHSRSHVAQFFLEWKMFQTKVVEKIKTHILCPITFCRISYRLWDNAKNFVEWGRSQMTRWRSRIAWRYLRLQTHTKNMKYLLLFHCNDGCKNAPQCYVIRTLLVFLVILVINLMRKFLFY